MDVLQPSEDPEGAGSDDLTGRKKSRLRSLKSRLFGKKRRKDEDNGGLKQSQSESDITWGVEDSEHVHCSQGILGSRALSHDSIFMEEHSHSDPEPQRGLSQENIHGKIRALQMKLQQQKIHFGPPPLLLPIKRLEDLGGSSEDDCLPRLCKNISNKASPQPLSPRPISPTSAPNSPFAPSSEVDFSTPPQFFSLLDNSAAHHRMSIKPKNRRASAKNKSIFTSAESRPRSESLNHLERSLTDREQKEGPAAKVTPHVRSYSSKVLRSGERQTASQIKSTSPVLPLMSLQGAEESRQVSSVTERNLLSTSPQCPGLKELTSVEAPVPTTRQEASKETKCLARSDEAQAAKPPSPVVSIDRKEKGEVSSSKLLTNSLLSTLKPSVDTTQKLSIMQGETKSNDVVIQTKMSKCGVENAVNIENRNSKDQQLASTQAPVNVISGVNLRPSSLRRNAPSTDEKSESKTLQPVMTVGQEEHSQTESTKRQRPISGSFYLTLSSDKTQERPRTASFTGVIGQAGLKKEPPSPSKPPLTFKIKGQLSAQSEKAKKDPCSNVPPESQKEDKALTNPVIQTKFTDLSMDHYGTQDVEENKDNEMQEIGVEATEEEVQEEVEEAEEAGEDVTEDDEEGKEREATNAFGVKLRSSSLSLKFRLDKAQSETKVKQHSAEVSMLSPPVALSSDSTSHIEPEDQRTKLRNPPLQTNESSTSSCTPKSVCKEKERTGLLRKSEPPQPSSSPSKATKIVPSLPKEGADLPPKEPTAVSFQENTPTSTASEVSWMEMAREKTRSLQQLFTSRLPEFPGLQTATRSTTLNTTQPQVQTSTTQANARITQNITSQQTATQLPLRPTEVTSRHLPSTLPSGKATQPMQTHTRTTSQPSAVQTCITQTTTSQSQVDNTREVLFQSKTQICNSTKPSQSTVTCASKIQSTTHTIQTAKQLSSQPRTPQTPPIQQSSPLHAGPLQASQTSTQSVLRPTPSPAYLSSSPKLTSHLILQQSANIVFKDQPQNEGGEPSITSGKADRVSVPQVKGTELEDGRSMWAAGLRNRTPLVQRWENQSTAATKVGEQKDTPESQTQSTVQSTVPLRPISKVSGTDTASDPKASVSCVAMRTGDREEKWQNKSVPPSSSPSSSSPLQSVGESGQPSWMELAKRKSLAWSDKTMD